jgi:hypothetical protein
MKIALQKAIELLSDSAGIVTDKGITFPTLFEVDEPVEPFLEFEFTDDDGFIFEYKFYVKENQEVELVGSSLFLIDSEKETIQITLLKNWQAENDLI